MKLEIASLIIAIIFGVWVNITLISAHQSPFESLTYGFLVILAIYSLAYIGLGYLSKSMSLNNNKEE